MEEEFVSVYVDMAARLDAVRAAVCQLPKPQGVSRVEVDTCSVGDMFGCRIAVDLTGTFGEVAESIAIARTYADALSAVLGVPAFAFYDLLRRDYRAS
jgi:hypothetical protein